MSTLPEENRLIDWKQLYDKADAKSRTRELKRTQEEAEIMSSLTADPRWERYGRKLEAELKRATQLKDRLEAILLTKVLKPEEYIEAKVHQAANKGAVEALRFALTVAQTLIEKGEMAVAELNLMENGEAK